jgi:hypothetical protein
MMYITKVVDIYKIPNKYENEGNLRGTGLLPICTFELSGTMLSTNIMLI